MFKNVFKRKKSKKQNPTISSPEPIKETISEPTVIEATIEPTQPPPLPQTALRSSSVGTQAEFSPIRAHPSLLQPPTVQSAGTVVRPPSPPDPGYSTVQDALINTKPVHISDRRKPTKVHVHSPVDSIVQRRQVKVEVEERDDDSSSVVTDVTESDIEEQQHVEEEEEMPPGPIYAKVMKKKVVKPLRDTATVDRKKEVSFERGQPLLNDEHNDDGGQSEEETIQRSTSLPSHRPPLAVATTTHQSSLGRRAESVNLQSLNLSNLPVYSLNQTVPLASGDRAYLLTRRGPDGKEETFTATVITPTSSPSPHREKSSSIPTLSSPLPPYPPTITSTPITRAHSLQHGVNITPLSNNQPFVSPPPNQPFISAPPNMVRKTKPIPFPTTSKLTQSTQTEKDDSLGLRDNEILKESLAQMSAELSTYSLNGTETDISLEGVPVEQLIQEIPCRLQNALKTLNETLAARESQLESHQNDMARLKTECKELKKANQNLTKVLKEHEECSRQEKAHLEGKLSTIETEKDSLLIETQSLRDKVKQSKSRHKTKVKELTEDLNRLSRERDSFKRDLLEVQSSHTHTQSLLDRHSSRPTVSIPLDEHRKTLHEFESLLQDVVKTSKSNQKINSLKKENLSLMTQLNNMEEECTALRKEQRNYEERLFKLQNDLQQARSREFMITNELTQAMRIEPTRTTVIPSYHRSAERLHTKKPSYRSMFSNT